MHVRCRNVVASNFFSAIRCIMKEKKRSYGCVFRDTIDTSAHKILGIRERDASCLVSQICSGFFTH